MGFAMVSMSVLLLFANLASGMSPGLSSAVVVAAAAYSAADAALDAASGSDGDCSIGGRCSSVKESILLQRADRRSRVAMETDEGFQADSTELETTSPPSSSTSPVGPGEVDSPASPSPNQTSDAPDVGLEAEGPDSFANASIGGIGGAPGRGLNSSALPGNGTEGGARSHPALPLCHPSMLRRSSWSKSEDTGEGCYVTKAAIIGHLSATSDDVEELWRQVQFPPDEDSVECSLACSLLVDFVRHAGGVLPPSSDLGCFTLNGTTRCDIDLRPNTVVKSLGPAMYAGGTPDEGPLWAGTSPADRANASTNTSSSSSSSHTEEGEGEKGAEADDSSTDDVQEMYADVDGTEKQALELDSEAVLLQQPSSASKNVALVQVVSGGAKQLSSRWTWGDLVSPAYWMGSSDNESDVNITSQIGQPTAHHTTVTRVKREERYAHVVEADDFGWQHHHRSHHRRLRFFRHRYRNAFEGHGAIDIDSDETAPTGISQAACVERCSDDAECDCATFHPSTGTCWKRKECNFLKWTYSSEFEVLSKPRSRPFLKHGNRKPMRKEPCSYTVWELVQRLCASFRIYISSGRDIPVTSSLPPPPDSLSLLQNGRTEEAEEAIAESDIKARAWASTVLSEMTSWNTPEFRQRWFGGEGNLSSDEVRDRVLQTMNFVSRELMEGMHYVYPADDAEYSACGENVVAYVWKWVSSEEGYYETTGPVCNATDALAKRCGLADDGKYFVYLCRYWFENIDPSTKVATLVHEASHHAGPSDISYNAEVMQQLTQAQQLDNAANYHNFAQDVVDSSWDCYDDDELTGDPFDSMDCAGNCVCESLVSYCEDDDESMASVMQSKCQATCGSCSAPTTSASESSSSSPSSSAAPTIITDEGEGHDEAPSTSSSSASTSSEASTSTTTTTSSLVRVLLTTPHPGGESGDPGTTPSSPPPRVLKTTTKEPLPGEGSPLPKPPPAWTSPFHERTGE